MNYIEQLTKSIDELEANSKQLTKITELLKSIKELIAAVQDEKNEIVICKEENQRICEELGTELESLHRISDSNELAFQNIAGVIKEGLIKSKSENLEAIESFAESVSGKLTISQTSIIAEIVSKLSSVETNLLSDVKKNRTNHAKSIDTAVNSIEEKLTITKKAINSDIKTEANRIENIIDNLERQNNAINNSLSDVQAKEENIRLKLETQESKIEDISSKIENQNTSLNKFTKEIKIAQSITFISVLIVLVMNVVNYFL